MTLQKSSSVSKNKSPKQKSGEAQTMEELLALYGSGGSSLKRGDKVKGKIIAKESKRLVLDIGAKGEGIVAEKAYQESKDYIKELKVGDEVTASVIVGETPDGYTILSLRNAMADSAWKKLEEAREAKKPVAVLGNSHSTSGLTVEVEGLYGFVPTTQLGKEASKNPQSLVGKNFKVLVIDLNRSENKIILSEKEVSEAEDLKEVRFAYEKIKEGEIYEGKVTTVSNFGCFIEIEVAIDKKKIAKVEGLVHISEISWSKITSVADNVTEGEKVKVKVISKNEPLQKGGASRLALSIKQAKGDPWKNAAKKYKKDDKVKGSVVRLSDFGAFVELEEGVEGLIHITKIPPGQKLEVGKSIDVYIEDIDPDTRKLSLGVVLTTKPVGYK